MPKEKIWSDDDTVLIEPDESPRRLTDDDWAKCEPIEEHVPTPAPDSALLAWDYYIPRSHYFEEGIANGILVKGNREAPIATAEVAEFF